MILSDGKKISRLLETCCWHFPEEKAVLSYSRFSQKSLLSWIQVCFVTLLAVASESALVRLKKVIASINNVIVMILNLILWMSLETYNVAAPRMGYYFNTDSLEWNISPLAVTSYITPPLWSWSWTWTCAHQGRH